MRKQSFVCAAFALLAAGCSDAGSFSQLEGEPGAEGEQPFLLKRGDTGESVKAAHAYFNRYGYFESEALQTQYPQWKPVVGRPAVDETVFGIELERAVSAFQARSGLPVTGAIDAQTKTVMDSRFCGVPDSYQTDGQDKWDPHETFGFRSKKALTYKITIDATDRTGGLNVAQIAQSAFNAWRLKSDLTFTPTSGTPDISISFVDRSDNILGIGTPTAIFMTNRNDWGTSNANMLTVMLHEIGHTLGFDHSSSVNGAAIPLMFPTINSAGGAQVSALTQDEFQALAVSPYTRWEAAAGLAGEASDIGSSVFGGAEHTWKVGNGSTSEGPPVWRWKTEDENVAGDGGSWLRIDGAGGSRIDVAGRVPWVVVSAGATAGLIKSIRGLDQSRNGTGWDSRGNCGFVDVGANARGDVWALGGTPTNGDYQVYRFIGGTSTSTSCSTAMWRPVSGAKARYIDVAPDGSPWIVASAGTIRHRNGVTSTSDGSSWSTYGGLARDIAVGPDAWGSYGAVWITGHPTQTQDIFLLNIQPGVAPSCSPSSTCTVESRNQWYRTQNGGSGAFISVGKDALPWVAASNGSAWRRRPF